MFIIYYSQFQEQNGRCGVKKQIFRELLWLSQGSLLGFWGKALALTSADYRSPPTSEERKRLPQGSLGVRVAPGQAQHLRQIHQRVAL